MANAGRYRTRMRVLSMKVETDDSGGPVLGRVKKPPEIWCMVAPLSMRDRLTAGVAESEITHEVRTRHRNDISPHDKLETVRTDNRLTLEIVGLNDPAQRHDELVLLCAERR